MHVYVYVCIYILSHMYLYTLSLSFSHTHTHKCMYYVHNTYNIHTYDTYIQEITTQSGVRVAPSKEDLHQLCVKAKVCLPLRPEDLKVCLSIRP